MSMSRKVRRTMRATGPNTIPIKNREPKERTRAVDSSPPKLNGAQFSTCTEPAKPSTLKCLFIMPSLTPPITMTAPANALHTGRSGVPAERRSEPRSGALHAATCYVFATYSLLARLIDFMISADKTEKINPITKYMERSTGENTMYCS